MSKNDELCIKNEEFCIKNEELRIKNEELWIENDELCSGLCGGHRRTQINLGATCSAMNLATKVDEVNAACCDNGACDTAAGSSGIPRICDAKCAMVYAPFYRSCGYTLGQQGFVSAPPLHSACLRFICMRLTHMWHR